MLTGEFQFELQDFIHNYKCFATLKILTTILFGGNINSFLVTETQVIPSSQSELKPNDLHIG
jgi:hypothetical protein